MIRLGACSAIAVALLLLGVDAAAQQRHDYWFAAVDPVVQKDRNVSAPADYMDLFRLGTPWKGSADLKGFKLSTQMAFRGTDDQLRTIIDGLKARNIGMSIELGLLVYSDTPPSCGKGSEGIGRAAGPGRPSSAERVAERLSALGGKLDYVELDEPVTWGYSRTGMTRAGYPFCHKPITDLVDEMAPQIATLQRYFPNVQFGLVDSINGRWPDLPDGIVSLVDTLKSKLDVRVAFVHTDVAWDSDWQPGLRTLAKGLRSRGVRFGVICDGDVDSPSDDAWTTLALQRCRQVNSEPATHVDDFEVQSWTARPERVLPEDQPGTLSWLLKHVETIP